MHAASHPLHSLFLCTHNSARGILAEAVLNHIGKGCFKAYSAGSSPPENQQPHPLGQQALEAAGMPTAGLRSKNWDEFGKLDSPRMDLVITVCDTPPARYAPTGLPSRPSRTGAMPTRPRSKAAMRKRKRPSARPCWPCTASWPCWSACRPKNWNVRCFKARPRV